MRRDKNVIFRVNNDEQELIKTLAAVTERSQSDVIRLAVKEYASRELGRPFWYDSLVEQVQNAAPQS